MNREMKFRGKSLKYENWLFGSLWIDGEKYYIIHEKESEKAGENCWYNTYVTEVVPSTIGQYSGLKDKNGTEIYNGDILSENGNIIGVVVWSARYGVSIRKKNTTWALINFCPDSDFGCGTLSNIEVIGNIHDNPELLQ